METDCISCQVNNLAWDGRLVGEGNPSVSLREQGSWTTAWLCRLQWTLTWTAADHHFSPQHLFFQQFLKDWMRLPRLEVEVCLAFHLPHFEQMEGEGKNSHWDEGEVESWVLWVSSHQGEREEGEGTWSCNHAEAVGTCPCNSPPCNPCVWVGSRSAWGVGEVVCGEGEGG